MEEKQNIINNFISTSKLIQLKLKVPMEESSRIYLWTLVKKISDNIGYQLPFKDEKLEKYLKEINTDLVDIKPLINNPDLFDLIYEELIPKVFRKKYGQFITPDIVAKFMVKWGCDNGAEKILDPSIGTGIFLSELIKQNKQMKYFLGMDIDSLMLNISYVRMKIIGKKNKTELLNHNFLEFHSKNEKFDFIVCNPPYMKFHNYDRNKSVRHIESEFNLKLSKLTNIYSLFFINTLSILKEGGAVAFITPTEFLYTGYGKELKKFLLDNFTIDAIILSDLNKTIFNDALTSATVTLLRKKPVEKNHKVKFIKVMNWDSNEDIFKAIYNSKSSNDIFIKEILQRDLDPLKKWLILFDNYSIGNNNGLIQLKDIADVKRGIATGHNIFFTLNCNDIEKWGIENEFIRPVVSKAKNCSNYILSEEDFDKLKENNEKVFLLYCFTTPSANLRKYIDYGKNTEVNKRYLTSKREPWYSMEKRTPAPILATVFSRGRMRFVFNKTEALNLASFHGLYPKFKDENKIKALLAYLNSNECKNKMLIQKRTYGGGLDKFEPNDLENILVLDITKLNEDSINHLSKMFDKLCLSKTREEEEDIKINIDNEVKQIIKNY